MLAKLRVALIVGAHLHVAEVEGLLVGLVRRIGLALVGARGRVARIVALDLLLQLVLPYQILVPCGVIVIREELGQQKIHIGALLRRPIIWLQLSVLIWLGLWGVRIRVVVAQIEAVQVLSVAVLDAATLLAYHVVVDSRVLVGLQALVAHREHLSGEGLGHDRLAALACRLR